MDYSKVIIPCFSLGAAWLPITTFDRASWQGSREFDSAFQANGWAVHTVFRCAKHAPRLSSGPSPVRLYVTAS